MTTVAIAYHSGYGHTEVLAQCLAHAEEGVVAGEQIGLAVGHGGTFGDLSGSEVERPAKKDNARGCTASLWT